MSEEISYKLAKQLKDAGFPQKELGTPKPPGCPHFGNLEHREALKKDLLARPGCDCYVYIPTLSELIEEIGYNNFWDLLRTGYGGWQARDNFGHKEIGENPKEAVAKLYLKLYVKSKT